MAIVSIFVVCVRLRLRPEGFKYSHSESLPSDPGSNRAHSS